MAGGSARFEKEFSGFAAGLVAEGRYPDADAVWAAAQAALLAREQEDNFDTDAVRKAVEEGVSSGVYAGDIFADLKAKYGLDRTR